MTLPRSVVVAALGASPRSGPLTEYLKAEPNEAIEALTDIITAAVSALPRSQCDQLGHDFKVFCSPENSDPHLVVCQRCQTSWPMHAPTPVVPAPDPLVTAPPRIDTPKAKKPRPRDLPVAAPSAAAPASAPVESPSSDEEPAELPAEPQAETGCTGCGGELESENFAAEVAKNFKGARLCRDCLLSCESCGGAIESIDQAKISNIRWQSRLCVTCHKDAAPASS